MKSRREILRILLASFISGCAPVTPRGQALSETEKLAGSWDIYENGQLRGDRYIRIDVNGTEATAITVYTKDDDRGESFGKAWLKGEEQKYAVFSLNGRRLQFICPRHGRTCSWLPGPNRDGHGGSVDEDFNAVSISIAVWLFHGQEDVPNSPYRYKFELVRFVRRG
jgi:hypothetical protein